MSEALKMVKAEMGLDAMILSSKKERRKGIMGFFSKPYFEVTAALDPRPAPRPNPYREEPPPAPVRELSAREEFQNSMLGPLAREVRELKQRIEQLTRSDAMQQVATKPQPVPEPAPAPQAALPEAEPAPRTFAKEELEEIKKLLFSAMANKEKQEPKPLTFPSADAPSPAAQQPAAAPAFDPQLLREQLASLQAPRFQEPAAAQLEPQSKEAPAAKLRAAVDQPAVATQHDAEGGALGQLASSLRHEELAEETVEMLIGQLRGSAQAGASLSTLKAELAENLAALLKCSGTLRMKKNGPRIMAIVGPTGVGKTTTIAKLAAMHALTRGASVALVTTDNFRVGAIEQLRTYAKIMDLPLEVAATEQELAKVIERHADKDLILIDTTGRSHKDGERLEELKSYLECHPGIETFLCMSATTRGRELDKIVETFGCLPISRFLFTKLDESESYGCIVNTHLKYKLPVSYLTTGQKVPDDIEVATPKKIAALVVKESAR